MCEAVSVTGAGFDQGSHPVNLCAHTLLPLLEKKLSDRWGGRRKRWRNGLTFRLAADTIGACRVCGCPDTRLSLTTSHVRTLRGTHCRRHPAVAAKGSGEECQAQDRLHSSNRKIINITQVTVLVACTSVDLGTGSFLFLPGSSLVTWECGGKINFPFLSPKGYALKKSTSIRLQFFKTVN